MRVFTAAMMHETNRFSPIPTDLDSFREYHYIPGGKVSEEEIRDDPLYGNFVSVIAANNNEVVVGPAYGAQPSGLTAQKDYETVRDSILDYLVENIDKIDCVALFLHGAQMAHGYDDCEGDLLSHVREIVGPGVPVAALLDLHCNLSDTMVDQSTFLMACKEYPHTDYPERTQELIKVLQDCVDGKVTPVTAKFRVPMTGAFHTPTEPLRGFVDKTMSLERDDVLSISMMHGFAWADTPDTTANMIVTTNNNPEKAEALARSLGCEFFEVGKQVAGDSAVDVRKALRQAEAVDAGMVVIADTADNAGGGAPSDSTFILKELLEQGVSNVALGMIWDPVAVSLASKAEVGSFMNLRIGGKVSPESGNPIDIYGRIIAIDKGEAPSPLLPKDPRVAIRVNGIDIVLNSLREQVIETKVFTSIGIDISKKDIVVVKSSQHFYDQFAPLAARVIYCDTPGVLCKDLSRLDFKHLPRPIWPLDEGVVCI
ncbi:MAG: M81 family metallopeptidase [Gammaproteobacteria bacterium]|nr:M81 family metallopeptidase [Gammaproteobacteria bacterium]